MTMTWKWQTPCMYVKCIMLKMLKIYDSCEDVCWSIMLIFGAWCLFSGCSWPCPSMKHSCTILCNAHWFTSLSCICIHHECHAMHSFLMEWFTPSKCYDINPPHHMYVIHSNDEMQPMTVVQPMIDMGNEGWGWAYIKTCTWYMLYCEKMWRATHVHVWYTWCKIV
jgi:hypothetical protein